MLPIGSMGQSSLEPDSVTALLCIDLYCGLGGSKSNARKAASAMIAKIPFPLANYLARHFKQAQP